MKIWGVASVNKTGQQKSMCTDCDSRISTFLNPIKPYKNQK